MKTSDYIDYDKMLKDVFSRHLENIDIDFSYYEDKTEKEYDRLINTIKYLDSFNYEFDISDCRVNSDSTVEISLLFDSNHKEEMSVLDMTLDFNEEWISDFQFN